MDGHGANGRVAARATTHRDDKFETGHQTDQRHGATLPIGALVAFLQPDGLKRMCGASTLVWDLHRDSSHLQVPRSSIEHVVLEIHTLDSVQAVAASVGQLPTVGCNHVSTGHVARQWGASKLDREVGASTAAV